jgi:hypothetical protein
MFVTSGQDGVAVLIRKIHIHPDVFQRTVRQTVINGHGDIKGLSLQGQLLKDLDRDPGSDRIIRPC